MSNEDEHPDAKKSPETAAHEMVEQVQLDVDAALSGLADSLDDHFAAVAARETDRCLAWVRLKLAKAKIIEGIESYEDPPGYEPGNAAEDD